MLGVGSACRRGLSQRSAPTLQRWPAPPLLVLWVPRCGLWAPRPVTRGLPAQEPRPGRQQFHWLKPGSFGPAAPRGHPGTHQSYPGRGRKQDRAGTQARSPRATRCPWLQNKGSLTDHTLMKGSESDKLHRKAERRGEKDYGEYVFNGLTGRGVSHGLNRVEGVGGGGSRLRGHSACVAQVGPRSHCWCGSEEFNF